VCCGYRIINFAQGCTLGCSYCILEDYLDLNNPVVFENRDDLIQELREAIKRGEGLQRLGTGEFTDSLLFEAEFPLYGDLVPIVADSSSAVLEIKTKTTNIDSLLHIDNKGNTIVSWSMNSIFIAGRYERGAPAIDARIEAARRIEASGYKLAFHFDPIVYHDGWEEAYRETVEQLFRRVHPESVVYISMGTLRFPQGMRHRLEDQGARLLYGEFVRGLDGKMRYFRPLRTRMYRGVLASLKRHLSEDKVYLCMESPDVWQDVFGIVGMDSTQLAQRLDDNCRSAFPNLK
jgi:spore photoproduct lyase